jgi:serine/threonine protein kinase/lipopolysaccharide biosynthesis regulator YciM
MQIYPIGTRIGQYEIVSAPLMGSMGIVYFCLDHGNDDRPVALKTFMPEFLSNRDARDRFLREGTLWVELGSHPHIVRCYDVKYIDPISFLILELINKEQDRADASLRAWIGQPMQVKQAILFTIQIARGMQYATKKVTGLVHRNLTPANILVGADKLPGTNINRLRVAGFGLTTIQQTETNESNNANDQNMVGTPLYMAPEQWQGEPVGAYTDVYALGCTLYEMLTGQRAASGLTLNELKMAHCSGNLRPLPDELPSPVRAFLEHCLVVNTTQRYQSWNEVAAALENVSAELDIESVPSENEQISESIVERQSVASSYNAMGISYAHIGKTQVALTYFDKAHSIFREINDRGGEGIALHNLGNVYAALGDGNRAVGYYEQYLAIAREISDRRGEGNVFGSIGEVYRNLGDTPRAIDYFEQYLNIARELGDRRGEGNALCSLGLASIALGEVDRATNYFEQYLTIARSIGDRRGVGIALGNLGKAYATQGDMQRAVEFYKKYLEIAGEIGDRTGEGNALGSLGNVYLNQGDLNSAISFYEASLKIEREIGDRRGEVSVLNNLGTASAILGKPDEAFRYYKQGFQIASEIGDQDGLCKAMFNLGQLYMQNGQKQNALHSWVNLYLFAKNKNLTQVLQRLDELAPKVGISDGMKGWERLAKDMQNQGASKNLMNK